MPRKGTAVVKKADRYDETSFPNEGENEAGITESCQKHAIPYKSHLAEKPVHFHIYNEEHAEPAVAREQPKRSNEAQPAPPASHRAGQPRQASVSVQQSAALIRSLFSNEDDSPSTNACSTPPRTPATARRHYTDRPILGPRPRVQSSSTPTPHLKVASQGKAFLDASLTKRAANLSSTPTNGSPQRHQLRPGPPTDHRVLEDCDPATMIQGGAFIPANQQRNMRACMVCSIVRTQHQFMTQGCPNCEEILELANNSEQINDCTSQVFEGLISVADTNRSWVARYQRLEGYVPGVYATQVEGILPEDVLVAVENAGINYVPRDGSEQEMLGKD
jgi:transcription elongation factor SPT4